ncbi:conserved hypothetical protein, partial [Ixodes scapularis]
REELEKKANALAELSDLIYAFQLTYEEVIKKPKKEANQKKAIKKKKFEKFSQQLQIVTSPKQNEVASRSLKGVCKTNQHHSNNKDQLKKLEEQIKKKKKKGRSFRKANKQTKHCGEPDRVSENKQAVGVQSVRLLLETWQDQK